MSFAYQPAPRAKISCLPCRKRKSKCDRSTPCSSCVLRGTASECLKPGQFEPAPAPPKRRRLDQPSNGRTPGSSNDELTPSYDGKLVAASKARLSAVSPFSDEISRLRSGIDRLEGMLMTAQAASQSSSTSPLEQDRSRSIAHMSGQEEFTEQGRERWNQLRLILPPLRDTNMLMNYMFVEAYFLIGCMDVKATVAAWKQAFEKQAVSASLALEICCLTATAALLLSENRDDMIDISLSLSSIRPILIKKAVEMLGQIPIRKGHPDDLRRIRALLMLQIYSRYSGENELMGKYHHMAMQAAEGTGMFDESHPSWVLLDEEQIEARRTMAWELATGTRWMCFVLRTPLPKSVVGFRVGKPQFACLGELPSPKDWPSAVIIPGDPIRREPVLSPSIGSTRWNNDEEERNASRLFVLVGSSMATQIAAVLGHLNAAEPVLLKFDMDDPKSLERVRDCLPELTGQCLDVLRELQSWREEILPSFGFVESNFQSLNGEPVNVNKPDKAILAIQSLLCHHAIRFYQSALLRPWILMSDKLKRQLGTETLPAEVGFVPLAVLGDLEAEGVEVARCSIATVPLIRALQESKTVPFFANWVAASLFHSATTLAVPLLRIAKLALADPSCIEPARLKDQATDGRYPPPSSSSVDQMQGAPLDEAQTELAMPILKVLETLAGLSASPMARKAESLLENLLANPALHTATSKRQGGPSSSRDAAEGLALLSKPPSSSAAEGWYKSWEKYKDFFSSVSTSLPPIPPATPTPPATTEALKTPNLAFPDAYTGGGDRGNGRGPPGFSLPESTLIDTQIFDDLVSLDSSFWESLLDGKTLPF